MSSDTFALYHFPTSFLVNRNHVSLLYSISCLVGVTRDTEANREVAITLARNVTIDFPWFALVSLFPHVAVNMLALRRTLASFSTRGDNPWNFCRILVEKLFVSTRKSISLENKVLLDRILLRFIIFSFYFAFEVTGTLYFSSIFILQIHYQDTTLTLPIIDFCVKPETL